MNQETLQNNEYCISYSNSKKMATDNEANIQTTPNRLRSTTPTSQTVSIIIQKQYKCFEVATALFAYALFIAAMVYVGSDRSRGMEEGNEESYLNSQHGSESAKQFAKDAFILGIFGGLFVSNILRVIFNSILAESAVHDQVNPCLRFLMSNEAVEIKRLMIQVDQVLNLQSEPTRKYNLNENRRIMKLNEESGSNMDLVS